MLLDVAQGALGVFNKAAEMHVYCAVMFHSMFCHDLAPQHGHHRHIRTRRHCFMMLKLYDL